MSEKPEPPTRGFCPHCGRGDAAPTADEYEQQRQRADRAETELRWYTEAESADAAAGSYAGRAEQAEATIARVRAVAQWLRRNYPGLTNAHAKLAEALDPRALNGPTVAECAAADRLWWDSEKTGE